MTIKRTKHVLKHAQKALSGRLASRILLETRRSFTLTAIHLCAAFKTDSDVTLKNLMRVIQK